MIIGTWGKGFAREPNVTDFSVSPGAIRLIEDFPLDIFTLLNENTYNDLINKTSCADQGIHYLNRVALIDI
jgi:hypothetical protein